MCGSVKEEAINSVPESQRSLHRRCTIYRAGNSATLWKQKPRRSRFCRKPHIPPRPGVQREHTVLSSGCREKGKVGERHKEAGGPGQEGAPFGQAKKSGLGVMGSHWRSTTGE